jgi:DNA polymerase-3 subunit alpha (Gram-positive type)
LQQISLKEVLERKGITCTEKNLKELLSTLQLVRTLVIPHKRCWILHVKSPSILPIDHIQFIEKSLKEYFPEIRKLQIRVHFSDLKDDVLKNISAYKDFLIDIMKIKSPACIPWLENSQWRIKGKRLILSLPTNSSVSYFITNKCDKILERILLDFFDIELKIICQANTNELEDIDRYHQEKDEEEVEIVRKMLLSDPPSTGEKNHSKARKSEANNEKSDTKPIIIIGKKIAEEPVSIHTLREDSGLSVFEGEVIHIETRELRGGKVLHCIDITDYTGSITCKYFADNEKHGALSNHIHIGSFLKIRGECQYDKFQREITVLIQDINKIERKGRRDTSSKKRIELHLHTQLSTMDSVVSIQKAVQKAAQWGHPALAVTDHGVLQAFPDAYEAGKKAGVKILYGVEAYLVNDCIPIVTAPNNQDFSQDFVVFDIETTGLNPIHDAVTEIGAVKVRDRKIIEEFHTFVNPGIPIPASITKLTGITEEMVKDAPPISEVIPVFSQFIGDAVLVAHNASFDVGFIKAKGRSKGIEFKQPVLDTLALSRQLFKDLKQHKLNIVAKYLGIPLEQHHRAVHDATTTAQILMKSFELLEDKGIHRLDEMNTKLNEPRNLNSLESYHAVILAKDKAGLKNLYRLISHSHLDYFYRRPRIPKSLLSKYRQGLFVGSGCEAGELFRAVLNQADEKTIEDIIMFYDYLEIQPIGNNAYLLREGKVADEAELERLNCEIVKLGEKYQKPVVATGDVHFLEPEDEVFRRILMHGQGFSDADHQAPLYFKTTDEMLEEFSYLGKEKAWEVVVENPQRIADSIEDMKPFPDGLYPPEIEGAEDEIKSMALNRAMEIYGDPLPEIVHKRLKKELDSIINNGFAVLYLIAHKLVKKSLSDGYLVGSRGSVGSSFVATMTGITEVNPLPPHYVCSKCKYSDFSINIEEYGCGMDLPDKNCPRCGIPLNKDGFDIPFEVFLGFEGDKVPDIDLNFSGDYQPVAHKYTEELFGEGHVFRAGTIGTIAEKTAFGFVKKYLDEKGIVATNAEINRLIKGCTGVKRTTGQHPGGVIVVPKKNDVHEFTPIQHPADDKKSGIITTHFDFNSLHERLVKLDILGHDDPTVIRMLEDLTGVDARSIPIGEKETMRIFSGTEPLGIKPEEINSPVGTFGIPEFGTRFVRQMLVDTKPTTMAELVRISGLSHGTDVWLNNAQDLIRNGTAKLSEVIATRDDIMIYLIYKGLEPRIAFSIVEDVRKGKGVTPEFEEKMKEKEIPEWFIGSCKKIKYMFPKAHAAAYVMMAFRIAYYKVYYSKAFYATYFTVRADDFDAGLILGGIETVRRSISDIESKGNNATTKEKNILTILEIALEMYARGINFTPIDLYKSHATQFQIAEDGIRPSLNSMPGLGNTAAANIVKAREDGPFISIEDLQQRAKVSKSVIEILRNHKCLDGIPETSQISLF